MIHLLETVSGTLRVLLPPGRNATAWHQALVAEITRHLSAAHARLLAHPEPTAGGLGWSAEGTACVRYAELPAESRRALDVALCAILSDIRRLAESGEAPTVREVWPALREIPDLGHLFAVDGRPVLAAWGHAGRSASGRLAQFDDQVPWRAAPRTPWHRYGTTLAVLACLALTAGLLLPMAASRFLEKPAACSIMPGQLETLSDQAALETHGQQLQVLLAALTGEVGRRQLLCPVPMIAQASAASPPPPSALPPRADLPRDQWNQRDLSMLEGCWGLYTGLTVTSSHADIVKVRSWRMCFDGHGGGQQSTILEDNRSCQGPLQATFDATNVLHVNQPKSCAGTLQLGRSEIECRRISDSEAECNGRNLESNGSYTGRFRR